ncbi:SSU ribosomal protein S2p (SAe) [Pseudomonas synxantha]|nr:SSU ribosomal protein S2p (SAe) [Pseudomonas synxantha]
MGAVGGASAGGLAGVYVSTAACMIAFGLPTAGAGALACAIIGGAAGGLAVGKLGSKGGEWVGDALYQAVEG